MFSGQVPFSPNRLSEQPMSTPQLSAFAVQISDRHHLRLLMLSDAAELFSLIDANRAHLKAWLSWLSTTQTVDDTRHFIRLATERAQKNQGFAAAIVYDAAIVGVIGLHDFRLSDRSSSIGYWLARSHQGKGLMTTSCRALIRHSFETLNLNRLTILCASENHRSRAIPKRLGLTYEGTLREAQWLYSRFVDHDVYALLKRDWLS